MTPMKMLLVLILGVFAGGCVNYSDGYVVFVDGRLSSETRAQIDVAVQDWATHTGWSLPTAPLAPTTDCTASGIICVLAIHRASLDAQTGINAAEFTERNDHADNAVIYVPLEFDAARAGRDVRHELGHAFGLKQHTGPGTVMCATEGCMAATVTDTDVANLFAVRGHP